MSGRRPLAASAVNLVWPLTLTLSTLLIRDNNTHYYKINTQHNILRYVALCRVYNAQEQDKWFWWKVSKLLPFRGGVNFHSDDLDAVPRRHANATEQTLQGDDGRLTETQEKEEGAAGGDEHRASCTRERDTPKQKTRRLEHVQLAWCLFILH